MATTKFAYVKAYELPDPLLPNTFFVIRIDGQSFHRFSTVHGFTKPNDVGALQLMDHAAMDVMNAFPADIALGFGESDEYSLVFKRSCTLFNRRHSKILSTVISQFTSSYVFHWRKYFPDTELQYPPTFDGRIVVYPSEKEVRDYVAWRQADTHINNLYNTTFWALVQQGGLTTAEAHSKLKGTFSKDKNEILHSQFGINYNALPERFRKGSVLVRDDGVDVGHQEGVVSPEPANEEAEAKQRQQDTTSDATKEADRISRKRAKKEEKRALKQSTSSALKPVQVLHVDVIANTFWSSRPNLLA